MPYPSEIVGETTPPIEHAVDTRWLLAYAAVLDAHEPALSDPRHPGGLVAHPLFPVCLEWDSMLALRRQIGRAALSRDELARGVHATHDLHLHRAIRPGERFATTATIVSAEPRGAHTYEVVRLDTRDAEGRAVATSYFGSVFRGVALAGEARRVGEVPEVPALAPGGPRTETRELPRNLGHTYTECARIWNPIHTDPAVAAAAGLPDIILHGTCTLALAVGAAWPALGGPERATRICARFRGMVVLPQRLSITVAGDAKGVAGTAALADGTQVLADLRVLPGIERA
jgi:acyl dehydratase